MTDEEIRKKVEERVARENEQLPPESDPDASPQIDSKLILECLEANELGDGTLFAAIHRGRFLYCKNSQEWYEWAGHYWKRDAMNRALTGVEDVVDLYLGEYKLAGEQIAEISKTGNGDEGEGRVKKLQARQAALLARVRQLRGDKRRTACLKFSHTIHSPLAITGEEFDNRPMLFPCANGVIDLETGRLCPGRPEDFLTLASPIEFLGIDVPAEIWERSLLEIFGGDSSKPLDAQINEIPVRLVAYLQRLLGYCMSGLVKEKIFPVLYGRTGWNGRSLIVETVSRVMGAMAGSIPSEMLLSQRFSRSSSGPSPDTMSLKGIRFAFASEIDEGQRFSAAEIKKLTGKDELYGRNPHDKYPTRFAPTHKLMVMSNSQPEAPPNDKAFWERLHLIPFLISFVNRDPQEPHERRANLDLDLELRTEASGILAWLVRGHLLYQQRGIDPPPEITAATEEYRRNEDILADFIDACCRREEGLREKGAILYNRFVPWYHENIGKKEWTGTKFGKQMSQKFDKIKSNGSNVYIGVALAEDQGELPAC